LLTAEFEGSVVVVRDMEESVKNFFTLLGVVYRVEDSGKYDPGLVNI
jgi:hypothetical protein